ncbi:MAG: hypothetical protein HQ592_17855, partial [Planctomycetes bacterium]|nr:hypothetical protein [Planctomycetota bacterium]
LLDELRKKDMKLEDVEKKMLPENMQKMTAEEQAEYIAEKQAARDTVSKQIQEISTKRNDFIKQKLAEDKGARSGFDQQVVDALKAQAAKKHIRYE